MHYIWPIIFIIRIVDKITNIFIINQIEVDNLTCQNRSNQIDALLIMPFNLCVFLSCLSLNHIIKLLYLI